MLIYCIFFAFFSCHGVFQVILECINKELGYTPDLAQVWTSDGRRQAWVYIAPSDTYYFIGAVILVEKISKEQLQYSEVCPFRTFTSF